MCRLSQEVRLRSLGELSQELRAALPSVLQFGLMPNKEQLLEAGRSDLLQAIRVRICIPNLHDVQWQRQLLLHMKA